MDDELQESVVVRPARVGDLPLLVSFLEPFVNSSKLLPRTLDELEVLLPHLFVAEADGALVGCAALEIYSKKLAEVRSLAVAAECQGQGIGKRLVQACVDRARHQQVLEVMAITSSEQFFKTCGFDFTLPGEKKALFLQTRER